MAGSIQQLFDNLAEGLAILSEAGVVRFANAAFTQALGATLGQQVSNVLIEQAIRESAGGYRRLPIRLTVAPATPSPFCRELQATLLASPFGPGYALVVRNPTMEGRYETVVANLAELLASAVDEPLKTMQAELTFFDAYLQEEPDCPDAGAGNLRGTLVRMRSEGDLCIGRLRQLATFAASFAHAPIVENERIDMMQFRSALIQRLRPLQQRNRVAMKCVGFDADLPVVYGSMAWLVEALSGYLEYCLHAAPVVIDFEVRLRGFGNFVLISVESGASYVPPHERNIAFSPFVGAVARRAPSAAREEADVLGLGLPLCKRIVDLHGGHVRLEQDGSQQAFRFEIELPCGDAAGGRLVDQKGLEQARRYAEDMASMMRRYRNPAQRLKPKGASPEIASQRNDNLERR